MKFGEYRDDRFSLGLPGPDGRRLVTNDLNIAPLGTNREISVE